jgi:hypothetical protein
MEEESDIITITAEQLAAIQTLVRAAKIAAQAMRIEQSVTKTRREEVADNHARLRARDGLLAALKRIGEA